MNNANKSASYVDGLGKDRERILGISGKIPAHLIGMV
jgi:hypothetical protein